MKTAVLVGLSRHRINVDGAGVTTLVAFHGCPLDCKYCLNPQALSPEGVWKRFVLWGVRHQMTFPKRFQ